MSISVHQASVGVFTVLLEAFSRILDKATAHAEAKKFDPALLMALRLRPDMLPFGRQVMIFCDHAKNASYRLAGVEAPRFEDNETSVVELQARIRKTLDHIAGLDEAAVDAGAEREILVPLGPSKMKMRGEDYLLHFALPNFYFHLTTAYGLLREAGVEVGKRDFLGAVPGVTPV